jgi:hypothetical protein
VAAWSETNLNKIDLTMMERKIRGGAWAVPRYQPTKQPTTARLVDDTPWLNMKSEVRRRLMPQWVELDLSAAYLAIFLKVLESHRLEANAPLLADVVGDDGQGVWARALAAFDAPAGASKDQLKEFAYATLFEASKQTAAEKLIEAGLSPSEAARVNDSPLAREMRRCLRKLSGWYRNEGHLIDAYGSKKKVIGGVKKYSTAVHFVCSSWELRLVARAYEVAEEAEPGAYIALHQHDGIAVGHDDPERLQPFVRALQQAVNAESASVGVRTKFVQKDQPR